MSDKERALRIYATINTPGWVDIEAIFSEHIQSPLNELFDLMVHKTGTLTGASAHLRAGKSRGCSNLLEEIKDFASKANKPQPARAG